MILKIQKRPVLTVSIKDMPSVEGEEYRETREGSETGACG